MTINMELSDLIIQWIRKNLTPDNIFTDKDLRNWAKNLDPIELFSDTVLTDWALDVGFKLP